MKRQLRYKPWQELLNLTSLVKTQELPSRKPSKTKADMWRKQEYFTTKAETGQLLHMQSNSKIMTKEWPTIVHAIKQQNNDTRVAKYYTCN